MICCKNDEEHSWKKQNKKQTKRLDGRRRQHNDHAMYIFFSLVDIIFKDLLSAFPSHWNEQVCGYSANNQGGKKKNTHDIQNRIILLAAEKYTVSRHHRDELNHNMLSMQL